MARFTLVLFALIAGILAFAARHGTLHDLKVANESMRQKVNFERPPPVAPRADNPSAAAGQLTPDEHAELLRLRGQILPLQQEIRDISNRVERATQSSSTVQTRIAPPNIQRNELSLEQRARMQATEAAFRSEPVQTLFRNATALGEKLQKYLRENNGELPQDLSVLDGAPDGFELMRLGSAGEEETELTLVARQKEPLQTADGKMIRVYVRANGTTVAAALPTNGDWTQWEQRVRQGIRGRLPGKAQ